MQSTSIWYLYMLRCANGQLYTGITTDITRRFSEHCANGSKTARFLRGKGPLELVYQEVVGNHSSALKREIAVKKLTKKQKLFMINKAENTA